MDEKRKALYEIMRCDICVMAEHGDDEQSLYNELQTATPDIIQAYTEIYL